MNKFLIASVALFGLAGVAAAQEAPGFYGYNPEGVAIESGQIATRSIAASDRASVTVSGAEGFAINQRQDYSGK